MKKPQESRKNITQNIYVAFVRVIVRSILCKGLLRGILNEQSRNNVIFRSLFKNEI
jgi:hypothetical protein